MTEREFKNMLRRGLGGAIVELKENPSRGKYRDVVMCCCLRNISYDWQVEGTRGHYLYSAICTLGEKDYFEKVLIDKFLSRCSYKLILQLSDILSCYAGDGSEPARNAFYTKYNYFLAKNGRLLKNSSVDEGFQWQSIACSLFDIDGFSAFKRYAMDIGELLNKSLPVYNPFYYEEFIFHAKVAFGKPRVHDFLEKMYGKSAGITALVDTLKKEELFRRQHQIGLEKEQVTIDYLVKTAREAASEENPRCKMIRFRQLFSTHASEEELVELAGIIFNEESETSKALLLSVFWRKPFPLEITKLIEYVHSGNELLSESATRVLEESQDSRIHDVAIQMLKEKGFDSFALGLLKNNYQKADDGIIHQLLKKASIVPQHVQGDVVDIYTCHRSVNALPILLHVYQRGECSHCRYGIVRAMAHCGVLPDEILWHCLYDSYEDTRKYAKRLIESRRKKQG